MDTPNRSVAPSDAATRTPEIQAIYDQFHRDFTAAELQKYTEIDEIVPMEQVLAELEEIHRRFKEKRA